MLRKELDLPCQPVDWRVAFFSRLGRRLRYVSLGIDRTWTPSVYPTLGGKVGDHSIDSVDSGFKPNPFSSLSLLKFRGIRSVLTLRRLCAP